MARKTFGVRVETSYTVLVLVEADDAQSATDMVEQFSEEDIDLALRFASTPWDHVLVKAESEGYDRTNTSAGEYHRPHPDDDWEPVHVLPE